MQFSKLAKGFFFLFSTFTTTLAFAQPANDNPCSAEELFITGTTCSYQQYTTTNATATPGVPAPGCAGYNGGDVWFKVTVPCTGNFNIDTQTGIIADGGMAVYTGDCSGLTLLACDDDSSPNGAMPMIQVRNQIPGETVYIRFWEYGNDNPGTFSICVTMAPATPPGGGSVNCNNAQPFCTGTNYVFPNVTGQPNGNGQGIYGCLYTIPNPVWYYMQVQNPGTLIMNLSQTSTSGSPIDVDFVMWGPFTSPSGACSQISASNIVDCSYSPSATETVTLPNAQVGQYYLIMITNYNGSPGTITFNTNSSSTATTNCSILCNITASNNGPVCPGGQITLTATGISTSGTFTWSTPGVTCQNLYGQTVTVTAPTTVGTYAYTVMGVNSAGTPCRDTTIVTVANNLTATSTIVNATCPSANDGSITINGGGGTYTLSPGNVVQTTNTFNNLAPGTYSVVFTNGSGCSGTLNNLVVAVNPNPLSGTAAATPPTCLGANNGSITVTPNVSNTLTYVLSPGSISQTNPTFSGLGAGTYSIVATSAGGCTFTLSNIVVAPGATLTGTAAATAPSCQGATNGSITVTPGTAGTYNYVLTPGGTAQASPSFTGLAAGSYSVTATNAAGCSFTVANITVPVGSALAGTASALPPTCLGASNGSLTVSPGTAGTYNYVLTPSGVSQASPTFSGLAAGSYSVTATNATGCNFTVSNISVPAGAALSGTATTTAPSCQGATDGSLTINPSTAGSYNYVLTPGGTTQTSPTFAGLAAGSYSVTATNALGCSFTVSNITIAAGTALTGTATTTPTNCPGVTNGSITVTPSVAGSYTYVLTPGGTSQASPTFNNIGSGTYSVTFTNALGCQGTVSNINVAAGPALATPYTTTNPLCSGINDGQVSVSATTGSGPYSFVLNPGGINQNGTSATYTGLSPNIAYTVTVTDAVGCQGNPTFTLTTNSAIHFNASAVTNPSCNGATNGVIAVSGVGGVSPYTYAINNGTFQSSGTFNRGVGTYTITVKDNVGCTRDTTITLTEPIAITASAVNSTVATCDGNDGVITVTANGGTTPYTYSINGTSFVSSNTITAPNVGNFTVTVKDSKGCTTTTPVTVTYTNNLVVNLGADTTICQEDSVQLKPIITGNPNVFTWTPGLFIVNPSVRDAVVYPKDTTTYTIVIQKGPCTATDEVTVNVKWKPIAHAGRDTVVCLSQPVILQGSVSNNTAGVNYYWRPIDSLSTPDSIYTVFTPKPDTSGFFIYTLHVTDDYGCGFDVTDQIKISVQPPVPAFAGQDTIGVKGVPHELMGSGGSQYVWSPASVLDNPFAAHPRATIYNDTRFYVQVTTEYGCVGYDTVLVKVYEGPTYYIPNAFTPNGDGLNDIFRPIPVGISHTDYFRIFNRFGELVFTTNQWLKGWDGTFKGKLAPTGAYVWYIKGLDRDGKVVEKKGTVMLIH